MPRIGDSAIPLNRKFGVHGGGPAEMPFRPRVAYLPGRTQVVRLSGGKRRRSRVTPRLVIRCGCCKEGPVKIFYDPSDYASRNQYLHQLITLEINGVDGGVQDWRAILCPLLGFTKRGTDWVDCLHLPPATPPKQARRKRKIARKPTPKK